MEKKLYVPKATKFSQKEDGSKQGISQVKMNCRFCNNPLSDAQVYEYLRGKSKGNCSSRCSNLYYHYGTIENYKSSITRSCKICNKDFTVQPHCTKRFCGTKCAGKESSLRMKDNNPMKDSEVRKKVSDTLKRINHKPKVRGGNGKGPTIFQKLIFDELIKIDDSFKMEYIFKTKPFNQNKTYPSHYKVDIASEKLMIAIEVDGNTHNSNKVKLWDAKKTNLLNSQGWKVLRLSNSKIEKELTNCVQMVLSMM